MRPTSVAAGLMRFLFHGDPRMHRNGWKPACVHRGKVCKLFESRSLASPTAASRANIFTKERSMKHRILSTLGSSWRQRSPGVHGSGFTACNVTYTISPQSSNAFGAAITINNTGTTDWTSWTVDWNLRQWADRLVPLEWRRVQSGSNVTVANESYNGSIAAGGSYTGMGFNGTWDGSTNAVPPTFAVNGTVLRRRGSTTTATTTRFRLPRPAPRRAPV